MLCGNCAGEPGESKATPECTGLESWQVGGRNLSGEGRNNDLHINCLIRHRWNV